ncbi:hypothetical protein CEXT_126921 [Caerostris extrusa]|uniref:Uncharacterized protein n=1 Tax=Caerostris extrusa TaxID=172846 RepID=A0AAV4VSE2_CAEEX|nr:hypothetical protein CEXT_126921 [Caerostris extrusa]
MSNRRDSFWLRPAAHAKCSGHWPTLGPTLRVSRPPPPIKAPDVRCLHFRIILQRMWPHHGVEVWLSLLANDNETCFPKSLFYGHSQCSITISTGVQHPSKIPFYDSSRTIIPGLLPVHCLGGIKNETPKQAISIGQDV